MNQLVTGKFIALKRKQKNLTQEQLAEKLGVSNKTISKWETGKCMPDYSIVKSLCEELEVTVAELMDGEISEENSVRTYDDEQILDLLRRTQELEKQKNMLYGIMLTDFWRVGKGYAKKLEEHGLFTMGDIARCSIGKSNEWRTYFVCIT